MVRAFLLLVIPAAAVADLTGRVVAFHGCKMKKKFMKDVREFVGAPPVTSKKTGDFERPVPGEVTDYNHVTVQWSPRVQTSVLRIFDDGEIVEEVDLHELKTKDKLHAMMKEKGFEHKPWVIPRYNNPEDSTSGGPISDEL